MSSRQRVALKRAALVVASLAGAAAIAEAAIRILVPAEVWRFWRGEHDWTRDSLGWVQKPDLDVVNYTGRGMVRFRTNPDGLIPAGARRAKPPGVVRIMLFGDSMVVGRVLPQDEIYSARLQALLRERGVDAEVINAGVQGYSTDQVLLQMERWLPVYRPDVAIYGSTFNDLGGNELARAHGYPKPRFTLGPAGELRLEPADATAEVQLPGNPLRLMVQHSALYRSLQPGIALLRARLGGWKERSLLGLMKEVYADPETLETLDWALYAALVGRMREVAEAEAAHFFFFAHPEASEVWEPSILLLQRQLGAASGSYDRYAVERRLVKIAASIGVSFLPVIDPFLASQSRGPFHLLPDDPHLSPEGHALLAEVLADHLIRSVLPELEREASARSR